MVDPAEGENVGERPGMGSGPAEYADLGNGESLELRFPSDLKERLAEPVKAGVADFLIELDGQRAEAGADRVPYIEGVTEDGTLVVVDELRGDLRGQRFGDGFVVYVAPVESFGEKDFSPTAADPQSIVGLRERGGWRTSMSAADENDGEIFSISKTAAQRTGEAEPNAMFRAAGSEYVMIHPLRGDSPQEQGEDDGSRLAAAREALEQVPTSSARVPAGEKAQRRGFLRRGRR